MRKIIGVGLILAMAQLCQAKEWAGNPDRFPSIGLNYTGFFESGDLEASASGVTASQDIENTSGVFAIDTRIPVSNSVTFNAALGFSASESTADETPLLTGAKSDTSGAYVNLGVRFYIK